MSNQNSGYYSLVYVDVWFLKGSLVLSWTAGFFQVEESYCEVKCVWVFVLVCWLDTHMGEML